MSLLELVLSLISTDNQQLDKTYDREIIFMDSNTAHVREGETRRAFIKRLRRRRSRLAYKHSQNAGYGQNSLHGSSSPTIACD
jgi:hypothetical protein